MTTKTRKATKHYTDESLPAGLTQRDFRMMERYDRLSKLYAERRSIIREKIIAAFGEGSHECEGVTVTTSVAMVLDKSAVEDRFPADKFPEYYKQVLDLKNIPAAIREEFSKPQPKVEVR